jgi:signal transduction histidine kinase
VIRRASAAVIVLVVESVLCAISSAETKPPLTVLTIHSGAENYPSNPLLDAGIRDALESRPELLIDNFSEYLEQNLFPDGEATLAFKDYLQRKYQGRRIDLVITITPTALHFALDQRAELFPNTPVIFSANVAPSEIARLAGAGVAGIVVSAAYLETLQFALALQPDTEHVFVIAEGDDQRSVASVRARLHGLSSRVSVSYIQERTLSGLLDRVRAVPPRSVILFIWYAVLEPGRIMYPDSVARLVAEASPVPVYGTSDLFIGSGVVGGVVRGTRETGTQLGRMALRILTGTRPRDMPLEVPVLRPVIDWRQMQRWGLNQSRLPPHSDIRFKPPTLWESYRRYVVGTVVVVSALLVLIGALLSERASRRHAENIVRAREASLQTSYDRIRQLNVRIINSQETARSALARELHDGVCQDLVLVLVALDNLKRSTGEGLAPLAYKQLSQLLDTTSNVVAGVRRLSHDLHPATLRLLGLSASVRAHCVEVERRNDVQVAFDSEGNLSTLHDDIRLCVFRIVQEALRNAVVHGEARRIRVGIRVVERSVVLTVTDDGCGFDVPATRHTTDGLGLISMEERVRLLNGTIEIVSVPRQGTTITAHIPADVNPDTSADLTLLSETLPVQTM